MTTNHEGFKKINNEDINSKNDIDQISAGGVVYQECDDKIIRIALIRDNNTQNWILPKGRLERGETLEITSLREVQEETGLQSLKLIKKIGTTNYSFKTKHKDKFKKEVHFFLFKNEQIDDNICVEEDHFDKGQWFTKDEAIQRIGFQAQKRILDKAFQIIEEEK